MRHLFCKLLRSGAIGILAVLMLFGCANVNQKIKDMNVGQKYENSKAWLKDKWQAVGSKFSSSDKEGQEAATKADEQKPSPKSLAAQQRSYHFEHRVQWPGETLSLIAKWYTGRIANWRALARANPGLNPNRIVAGNIIYIPSKLLKTKKRLPRKVVAKTLPGYFAHTVREPEQKLSDIASWYTGDKQNAKALAKANPDIDPEFLLVGNEIFIPSDLLKTRKSLGHKSVQTSAAKPADKPAASKAPAPEPEPKKIQLFGPKQFPEQD